MIETASTNNKENKRKTEAFEKLEEIRKGNTEPINYEKQRQEALNEKYGKIS